MNNTAYAYDEFAEDQNYPNEIITIENNPYVKFLEVSRLIECRKVWENLRIFNTVVVNIRNVETQEKQRIYDLCLGIVTGLGGFYTVLNDNIIVLVSDYSMTQTEPNLLEFNSADSKQHPKYLDTLWQKFKVWLGVQQTGRGVKSNHEDDDYYEVYY